jgi:hypothetical protein
MINVMESGVLPARRPSLDSGRFPGDQPLHPLHEVPTGGPHSELLAPNQPRCPRCGSADIVEVPLASGPHHGRLQCRNCGRYGAFTPKPWTIERALDFKMPFGRFRDQSMCEISRTVSGRDHLHWVASSVSGNPSIAARLVLGLPQEDGGK